MKMAEGGAAGARGGGLERKKNRGRATGIARQNEKKVNFKRGKDTYIKVQLYGLYYNAGVGVG